MKNIINENKNSKCWLNNRLDALEAKIIKQEIVSEYRELLNRKMNAKNKRNNNNNIAQRLKV